MNTEEFGFFRALSGDWGKACPKTFNEYTINHQHGVSAARIAAYKGVVFSVYDSNGSYYAGNRIKLMRDPSLVTSFASYPARANRRYTVAELARNSRRYRNMNPGSAEFDPIFASGFNGGSNINCASYPNPYPATNGYYMDPLWLERSGKDQDGTLCGVPAMLQTFDPDIEIGQTRGFVPAAFVAWTERYVDGPGTGYDSRFPISAAASRERRLEVNVQQFTPDELLTSFESSSPLVSSHVMTPVPLNVGAEPRSAVAPRVAAIEQGLGFNAAVAWAEMDFAYRDMVQTYTKVWAPSTTSASRPLYVAISGANDTWTRLPTLSDVCYPSIVSSGRATGRKLLFTGTHDIATMKPSTVDRPIVVQTVQNGAVCELHVKRYNGSTWDDLGGDLRANGGVPSFPRITVHENVPYITWVETSGSVSRDVRVRRYRSDTGTWDLIGGSSWAISQDAQRVSGPSIAVTSLGGVAKSGSDGSVVYVSAAVNEPTGAFPVADGAEGAWATVVSRCTLARQPDGSYACFATPAPYVTPKRKFNPTHNPVYDNTYFLGISAGQRNVTTYGGTKQLTGYSPDFKFANYPGSTDLIATAGSQLGDPALMYASWPGPVQDHRDYDQGLYVKKDEPLPAGQRLVATGGNFLISYPGTGTYLLAQGDNSVGQLGNGTTTGTSTSFQLPTPEPVAKLAANYLAAAALSTSGKLYTWGWGGNNQLCNTGAGTAVATPLLCDVPGGASFWFSDVSIGSSFLIALRNDGTVWARGLNSWGPLGNNTTTTSTSWVQVLERATPASAIVPMQNVASVYAGMNHSCAMKSDRKVWCWGRNDSGQLGLNDYTTPVSLVPYAQPIWGSTLWLNLAVGDNHAVGIMANGSTATWGYNAYGQLGLGDTTNRRSATLGVPPSSTTTSRAYAGANASYVQLGATAQGSCASGKLSFWAAGRNNNGQQIWTTSLSNAQVNPWTNVCLNGNFAQLHASAGSDVLSQTVHGDGVLMPAADRTTLVKKCLSTTCPSSRADVKLFDAEDLLGASRLPLNNLEPDRWGYVASRETYGGNYPVYGTWGMMWRSMPAGSMAGPSAVGRWNGPSDAVGVDPTGYCSIEADLYIATGAQPSLVTPYLKFVADDAWQGSWQWSAGNLYTRAVAPGSWVHLSLPFSFASVFSAPRRIDFFGLSNTSGTNMTDYGVYWLDNVSLKPCD